ncbi:MAG: molybdopterin cofactor synthesis protein A [Parcubacteria group bacterium GW2011_GWD2_40_9]|nr:MAG: molybdopterin cofactor synthesis protein A [Parcubacteria group bacterium GW2011_GWD2_40_9]
MKDFLKELIFWVVYMPGINRIYRVVYKKRIKNKLAEFKLSDLIVSIEPSNICNSKCIMCPYPKMTRPKEVMGIELFKKIVDDAFNEGVRNFNLNFYNEPFLDPMIFDRIKYLKSKGLKVSLYSNGSVANESIYDKIFESGIDRISFSIDGATKEIYEKIRNGLNFDETVKNVLGLIKRKKEKGFLSPKIRVVFVRQKANKNEVEEYKKFWQGKADSIVISTDDNRNSNSGFFKYFRIRKAFPCKKIWTEMIVMSNGKVALCCADADGEVILGDFNKQGFKEIWESDKFKKIRNLHLNFESNKISICKNCLHSYRMNLKSWWEK